MCVCADIQLTTEEYRRLEASTLNRLNEIKNRIAAQRSSVFGADFAKELRARQGQEGRFWPLPRQQDGQQQEPEACMGCSRPATVKISKKCETCPERAEVPQHSTQHLRPFCWESVRPFCWEISVRPSAKSTCSCVLTSVVTLPFAHIQCFCAPSWCHHCLLKWWLTKNTTKLEVEGDFDPTWQARCPTCRNYFCLNGAFVHQSARGTDLHLRLYTQPPSCIFCILFACQLTRTLMLLALVAMTDVLPLEGATIDDEEGDDAAIPDENADAAEEHRRQRQQQQRRQAAPIAAGNDPARARQLQAAREEAARQNAECVSTLWQYRLPPPPCAPAPADATLPLVFLCVCPCCVQIRGGCCC